MLLNKTLARGYRATANISALRKHTSASEEKSSLNNEKIKENYDIIVAGGGLVGCTLACALGKNSLFGKLKMLLLEGESLKKFEPKPEYSNRVVALNPNTKALMTSLNVWQHVEKARVQPVQHMQVWDACSDALISFSSVEADTFGENLAYIVENDLLLHSIRTELNAVKNDLKVIHGSKIAEYQLSKDNIQPHNLVKMGSGEVLACKLLLGADGVNSAVRKIMGTQYLSWDYDQMGIVATLHLAEETENTTAWQRFLPTGPVALLPLDSTRSSLVWSTTHKQAKELLKLPEEQFVDALNDALHPGHLDSTRSSSTTHKQAKELLKLPEEQFVDALNDALWKQFPRNTGVDAATSWVGSLLRRVGLPDGAARQLPPSVKGIVPNSRAAFPFGFGHSTRYVAPGVALVGDAAHRVHPLAGQGVNLGFGDVLELTTLLADAVYTGSEITDPHWLKEYETRRQRHNVPTQLAIEALHRLYTADLPPFVLLRSVGLQLTNALQPVKKLIMSQATT